MSGDEAACSTCGAALPRTGPLAGLCARCLVAGAVLSDDDAEPRRRRVTLPLGFRSTLAEDHVLPQLETVTAVPERIQNWRIVGDVEGGGMGFVYRAEHVTLGYPVAIKILKPDLARNRELVERFFKEALAAASIKNENIVRIIDHAYLPDGQPYIVMEWLVGQSLGKLLKREGRLPEARALRIAEGIANAIDAAHGCGIVHRDLKPDNIYLVPQSGNPDFVKVLDFGIAKLLQEESDWTQTRTGAVMGTPVYMAPEQCLGRSHQIDERTDVYALGVILYEILTGVVPFAGSGPGEIFDKHLHLVPDPPSKRVPGLSPWVDAAVLRALAKDQEQRPQSAAQLILELRGGVRQEIAAKTNGVTPSAADTLPPPSAWRSRVIAMALVAFLLALSAGGWMANRRSMQERDAESVVPAATHQLAGDADAPIVPSLVPDLQSPPLSRAETSTSPSDVPDAGPSHNDKPVKAMKISPKKEQSLEEKYEKLLRRMKEKTQ